MNTILNYRLIKNQSGQGLLSVMISISLSAIILVSTMTMNSNQEKTLRGFQQKSDKLELQGIIYQALSNSSNCSWQIQQPSCTTTPCTGTTRVIDTTNLPTENIGMTQIYSGTSAVSSVILAKNDQPVSPSSNLKVLTINFQNFQDSGTVGQLFADLVINFDSATLARPLAPITYQKVIVAVDTTQPANARPIISCAIPGSGAAAPVTPELAFLQHREVQCSALGGVIISDGANKFCQFTANQCPPGWASYGNWTQTSPNTCTSTPCVASTCTTGQHSWGNTALEVCSYRPISLLTGLGCIPTGALVPTCFSNIIKIGCY